MRASASPPRAPDLERAPFHCGRALDAQQVENRRGDVDERDRTGMTRIRAAQEAGFERRAVAMRQP